MNYGEPLEDPLVENSGKYDTNSSSFPPHADFLTLHDIAEMKAIIIHNQNVPKHFSVDDPLVLDVVFFPFGSPSIKEIPNDFNFDICTWRIDGEWWSGGSSIETECRLLRKGYLDVLSTGRKAYGNWDVHGRLRFIATIEAPFKRIDYRGYPKLADVIDFFGESFQHRYTHDSITTPYLETLGHKDFRFQSKSALTIRSSEPKPYHNIPFYFGYPQYGFIDYYSHCSFIGYSEEFGKIKVDFFYIGFDVVNLDHNSAWFVPHYLCIRTQEKGFVDGTKCCLAECFGITE